MSRVAYLQDAGRLLEEGIGWSGLAGDALGFVLAWLARHDADGRWLVVVDEQDRADRVIEALRFFHPHPDRVWSFPADDSKPYDGFSPAPAAPRERLATLHALTSPGPVVVVAPVTALMRRIPDAATRAAGTRVLRAGATLDRDALSRWLVDAGYLATGRVQDEGAFAVRGDIVDVWPSGAEAPIRIDFWDDEIEEIRALDPATQRARDKMRAVTLLAAREERIDADALQRAGVELARYAREQERGRLLRRRVFEEWKAGVRFSAVEDWLPALVGTEAPLDALAGLRVLVLLPDDVRASARDLWSSARQRWDALEDDERPLVPPHERYVDADDVMAALADAHPVTEFAADEHTADLGFRPAEGFHVQGADLAPVVKKLDKLAGHGMRVGLVVEEGTRAQRLMEMLGNHDLHPRPVGSPWDLQTEEVAIVYGHLARGFVCESSGWAFVPADALFGRRKGHAHRVHAYFDTGVTSLAQLKEGDHVVHRMHGVGLYRGMERLPVHGTDQDFVLLEYRDGDRLYLPVTSLDQISRYTPSRQKVSVRLDRLGGATWATRQQKVRDSVLAMANDLLDLQARREIAERPAYPPPGAMYRSFEARFPYDETPDQAVAIEAIQDDLSGDAPADRLICGDVGFGKTEVAMRAAMRVVEAGRQVAVLCPTTVLAFQHMRTFRERFEGLPVRVEMLSRFTGDREKKILAGTRDGSVDILVGTTRILGRGVRFADLGLLVIDEEHRFGVKQKERLKGMRAGLDVLSMSATPIPRTLEMALSGLRDMSVMATPPEERLSVRTSVARLTRTRVRDAVLQEVARGGQVFFIHNRIETIDRIADRLKEWVPEVRIAVAHGQMDATELEDILVSFIQRDVDLLVSTAIVETGIDLPNVNTMLVNRADQFGLAQLYQLRGRVGRASVRGNCILLTPEEMTKDARKRLRVLIENTHLGAGFQIASADLEMRGGGNLVGEAQSGNIDAVGYEMWIELLQEAVHKARGEMDRRRIEPEVEVPRPAFLPEKYVPDTAERLTWYRRLSAATDADHVDKLLDELEAFHGDLPEEAKNLGGLLQTKVLCRELGFVRCHWLKVRVLFELHPTASDLRVRELAAEHPKRFELIDRPGQPLQFGVRFLPAEAERPFRFLRWTLAQLSR